MRTSSPLFILVSGTMLMFSFLEAAAVPITASATEEQASDNAGEETTSQSEDNGLSGTVGVRQGSPLNPYQQPQYNPYQPTNSYQQPYDPYQQNYNPYQQSLYSSQQSYNPNYQQQYQQSGAGYGDTSNPYQQQSGQPVYPPPDANGAPPPNAPPPPVPQLPSQQQTSNPMNMMIMMNALAGKEMDMTTMMMISMAMGGQSVMPLLMSSMMTGEEMGGMDMTTMMALQMMSGGMPMNPMTLMMMINSGDELSDYQKELEAYMEKQWAGGKRKLSVNVDYGSLPLEYNFLSQMFGYPNPSQGAFMDQSYLNQQMQQGLFSGQG